MEENTNQSMELEVIAPSAIESLERAAVDVQVSTAHQYPRSLELFKRRALAEITMDEEIAESCVYVREVGSKMVNGKWQKEFAEGPSIRMAEIAFSAYGNIRAASDIIEQTPRYVKARGWAWDLETNAASNMSVVEPTVKKDGTPYSENMRVTVAKAAQAKAWRDAVIKVIGKARFKALMDAAKKVASGQGKTMADRLRKVQGWLNYRKIEEKHVFAALGVQGWSDMTEEHLMTLSGLKTSIMENEMEVDEAFPPIGKAPEHAGPVSHTPEPPKTAPKPTPKPPVKASQDKPQPERATEPPPATSDASQDGKPAEAATPEDSGGGGHPPEPASEPSEPPQTDEQAEAEAGLAPTTPETNATGEVDPFLAPKKNDTDGVASVKLLAVKSGVSGQQLRAWLTAKKLIKDTQKDLNELATSKIDALCRSWNAKLPEIRSAK